MYSDVSPKVMNSVAALLGVGGLVTAVGAARSDEGLRQSGAAVLGAALVVGAIGWFSPDPLREPYIEPGFQEPDPDQDPEVAEHRAGEA